MMDEISQIVKVDRIPSVNAMYEPILRWLKIPGGKMIKYYLGMMLSPEVSAIKNQIITQLKSLDIKLVNTDPKKPYYLKIIYVLNSYIFKRDLDNMNKAVIDAISKYFQFNDSRIFELHTKKLLCTDPEVNKYEYIKFYLGQLDEYFSDQIIKQE